MCRTEKNKEDLYTVHKSRADMEDRRTHQNLYINLACLFVCLSV